ncbi:TetR/AcrR family transcriptional regulator [Streptomyces sp. CMB-StM0423]|uniref:TetR/AcrR family transcriptional regulator n=1 Tax=Streptomyces sp. CMB-StM0423 TaxID=2059884 RepID=UPI000C704858|nr:TetR/AcrR family transcriptional regulator [Streptomyces sp. CMB-StM0423]AUH43545.1 TetR/AcrR family transcriptional regulator [Streptomyces sp. CMB-StM0423]
MKTRRTQQERTATTTKDLVGAARAHFARDGYAAASLDAICALAGITKGGLYHHFRNKQTLFHAVYAAEQHRLRDSIADAFRACPDPWDGLRAGQRAFLTGSIEPGTQRITLLDAPGALGWAVMREVQADCRAMTRRGLAQAVGAGRDGGEDAAAEVELDAMASVVFGALCECAMAVAHAPDPDAVLAASLRQVDRLVAALPGAPAGRAG